MNFSNGMIEGGQNTRRSFGIMRSIQAKLLTMLAVLSLPLLIVSLLQLDRYRNSMNEQASLIAQAEARAASFALENWLDDNASFNSSDIPLPLALQSDLYARLLRQSQLDPKSRLVVRDSRGRVLNPQIISASKRTTLVNAQTDDAAPSNFVTTDTITGEQMWTDNKTRITSFASVPVYGWTVAVGLPSIEQTSGGQSSMLLTAVWALALAASILIGVWSVSRLTKPLRRLTDAASHFGEGHLAERAVVETHDEVGTLAGTFNSMAESLEARFDELQRQSAFIQEVLDNLPLGVAVLDDRLLVRTANRKFNDFVGRHGDALRGRGIYEAAAGLAKLSEVIEDVRRTRQAFVSYGLTLELVAPQEGTNSDESEKKFWDVIIYPTHGDGAKERGDLLLILNEVSDRVRAESLATVAFAAERARGAELSSVINQMDDGVVIVDRKGRYRINPNAAKILGRAKDEFRDGVHALIEDFDLHDITGRKLAPEETPLRRALDSGERTTAQNLKIYRPSANTGSDVKGGSTDATLEERVLAVSVTPLVGQDEGREGAVAIFRDITEETRRHDELVSAYDRLREHDRLKSAFVANISHELRTPLNVITGLCHLLARDRRAPLADSQAEAVERMDRNAHNLLLLVNNLLDYSRLEAGRSALHVETLDVGALVREVVEEYASEARAKGVRVETEIAPYMRRVDTDGQKLAQVVRNLVGNAVKFTEQGEVRVRIAEVDDAHWLLEVSDTGIGMSRSEQRFVFDEFRQGDERLTRGYGGVGLGLAITRKIIELLGGEITVTSAPNVGSCFRILWDYNSLQRTGTGSLLAPDAARVENLRTRTG